jgi:hypothetical protein
MAVVTRAAGLGAAGEDEATLKIPPRTDCSDSTQRRCRRSCRRAGQDLLEDLFHKPKRLPPKWTAESNNLESSAFASWVCKKGSGDETIKLRVISCLHHSMVAGLLTWLLQQPPLAWRGEQQQYCRPRIPGSNPQSGSC